MLTIFYQSFKIYINFFYYHFDGGGGGDGSDDDDDGGGGDDDDGGGGDDDDDDVGRGSDIVDFYGDGCVIRNPNSGHNIINIDNIVVCH